MVDKEILKILCCPKCKKDLEDTGKGLLCKNCNKIYPIKEGIIIFLENKNSLKKS